MTVDFNRPVQTTNGWPVRILCTDKKGPFPVVGLVSQPNGEETTYSWRADGTAIHSLRHLINGPRTIERWVNVYPDGWVGRLHNSESEARDQAIETPDAIQVKLTGEY